MWLRVFPPDHDDTKNDIVRQIVVGMLPPNVINKELPIELRLAGTGFW